MRLILASLVLLGCADSTPRASYPPFDGSETEQLGYGATPNVAGRREAGTAYPPIARPG